LEKLNYKTIQTYKSFSTIEEMDQAVRGFLYKHKSSLSDGTIKVLTFIWRHSVKVIGVSFAKYDYIAEHVQLSRRTVIRAIKTLEVLSIIKKIPTARMNGKQGVNLLVIQPFQTVDFLKNNMSPQDVTVPVTPNKTENKQSSLCENKLKPINVNERHDPHQSTAASQEVEFGLHQELDTSFLPESVHNEFVQAAKPFLSAMDIYNLWNRVRIAHKKANLERNVNDVIELVISAFRQTVFSKKTGRIHSTFEGYFYSTVYANFSLEKRREFKRENKHEFLLVDLM
jgi:hypothetical protein